MAAGQPTIVKKNTKVQGDQVVCQHSFPGVAAQAADLIRNLKFYVMQRDCPSSQLLSEVSDSIRTHNSLILPSSHRLATQLGGWKL